MTRHRGLLVGATAAVLVALPLADGALLGGARGVGYAVCHQLPDHSLWMDGEQLPLCARCTGIYIGFLVGLLGLALQGRLRASLLPSGRVLAILLATFALMALDGFNSLVGMLPEAQTLYQTTNLLRLCTGMAAGISLALLLVPLLNDSLWSAPDPSPSVEDLGELGGYAVLAALASALVYSEHPALLYPIALASTVGVLAALSSAGAALAATFLRRKGQGDSPATLARPLLAGFALALLSLTLVGGVRSYFSLTLGL